MKNTIAERVADFLKKFPPFDVLTPEELLEISRQVKIKYLEKSTIVYDAKDDLHHQFYMINKGAISLKKEINGALRTVNKLDEGDVFGLRPIFARERYSLTANADEECILYGIPIEIFKPLAEKNRQVGRYLIDCFASNMENPYTTEYQKELFDQEKVPVGDQLFQLQPVRYVKKVITAKMDVQIKAIAKLMRDHDIGSVIIEQNDVPIGIVTDEDFRNKIATGEHSIDDEVQDIMSSPVICHVKDISFAVAQITMMKHNLSHICITEDGTPNTKIVGVMSNHDLVVMNGNNPAVLMKAIKRSRSTKNLKHIRLKTVELLNGYMEQSMPITHIKKVIFELNDATIKRVIERCLARMESPPPVSFAWISLGSQGRKEQLLSSDQDNAIIFEDTNEVDLEEVRLYFLSLAKKVNKRLDKIGFEFCPADIMAKNPRWCLSLSEWKRQFSKWTIETGKDELLLSNIFFDLDISYGDPKLSDALIDHIYKITKGNNLFILKMATSALRSPSPFGFFRKFLVEQDGAYKNTFNLKIRGLMPINDAARVLALHYQLKNVTGTSDRFESLAQIEPNNSELYLSCSYASKALLKFKTKQGLLNNDSGNFIDLSVLSKEEKLKLKRCFKTISRVQDLIKAKFNIQNRF